MTIGETIRKLRREKELSQDYIAEYVGITQEQISKIENGRSTPNAEQMKKFAEALGIRVSELYGEKKEIPEQTSYSELKTFGQAQYPLVSQIHAGPGTVKSDYSIESYESIEGPSDHKYQGALFFEVKGDSMKPKWEEGDLVLVHPKMKPRNGDYGVVCWDSEEGALKKIFFQKEKFILQSINSHYESVIVEPSSVWFIGKVLWTRHKQ